MLKLLVTGGLGFIGSNFIRIMMEKYEDIYITNLDKLTIGYGSPNKAGKAVVHGEALGENEVRHNQTKPGVGLSRAFLIQAMVW
jgi:dTDP-D-glucose 4,6-dehydratase